MTLIANTIIIVSIIPINTVFDKDSKGLFIYDLNLISVNNEEKNYFCKVFLFILSSILNTSCKY